MPSLKRQQKQLEFTFTETQTRIRRYTLDPRLAHNMEAQQKLEEAWDAWKATHREYRDQLAKSPPAISQDTEEKLMDIARTIDLVQRELVTEKNTIVGLWTVAWLVVALIGLSVAYLWLHGVRGANLMLFEPFPEWGPLKYAEVASWAAAGALCRLLYLATWYISRRDFDRYYRSWYVSTAIRAPFLVTILMIVVLEFVEWWGEGTWIAAYLLEEGNKFYFVVLVSFCMGLMIDETSDIIRDLANGVARFVSDVVTRLTQKLVSAFN